jgi:2-polyprenyl-6-hydroxyphenyl methylase/3-demethylubiquinone-9 3-methyltransferase
MTPHEKSRELATHFRFGKNWQSFLHTVSNQSIREAERGLQRLFPNGELNGRRFFDIGCGSGLSMLAASRLGAASVRGIDIDPECVAAARSLLSKYLPEGKWIISESSVFDLLPEHDGTYDIVYSWGVLHHTGDVWAALTKAAAMVGQNGLMATALYRKTPCCSLWTSEKKMYARLPRAFQWIIRSLYKAAYVSGLVMTGRNPATYINNYKSSRGMDWSHDIHDWLGGYPYESVEPSKVISHLEALGFSAKLIFEHPAVLHGLFGTHCDEFVFKK